MTNIQTKGINHILKFLIPSLVGIFLFMIPIKYQQDITIPIAVISSYLQKVAGPISLQIIATILTISFISTIIIRYIHKKIPVPQFFLRLFNVSSFWTIVRLIGATLAILTLFKLGPEHIWSEDTGGLVLQELLPILFSVFLFAGLFLPLLLNFGLLEFFGTLLTKLMRPVFLLPGRSSIDCLTSWLGDGTIGVLLTSKQYEEGYYTKKEAATIGTTFSVVSITFSLAVLAQVKLESHFFVFYLTVVLAGIIAAIICPRIPPLSRKENTYYTTQQEATRELIPEGYTALRWGIKLALSRAKNTTLRNSFIDGMKNVLDMWLGVLPVVMCFGTIGLIIANFTPFFSILGLPFRPLLEILGIPHAKEASQAIVAGFADMFLPAILISGVKSEMTRFIIACVSVTQLIYMSEVGSLLLGSKIPVSFKDLVIIFLQRTIITLPIIILVSYLIF